MASHSNSASQSQTGRVHPRTKKYLESEPRLESVLRPFLLCGFDCTWAGRQNAYNSVFHNVFLKPSPDLQETYGFEYEVLLCYHDYDPMEPRVVQAVNRFMNAEPAKGRVENLLYFLVSEDQDVSEWTRSYGLENREDRTVIPFSAGDVRQASSGTAVHSILSTYFGVIDRFKNTLPLESDTYFFGRKEEISALTNAVAQGENCGLFGLRKTGKTSVLLKVQRSLRESNRYLPIFLDGQSTSVRLRRWNQLLEYICHAIRKETGVAVNGGFESFEAADTSVASWR